MSGLYCVVHNYYIDILCFQVSRYLNSCFNWVPLIIIVAETKPFGRPIVIAGDHRKFSALFPSSNKLSSKCFQCDIHAKQSVQCGEWDWSVMCCLLQFCPVSSDQNPSSLLRNLCLCKIVDLVKVCVQGLPLDIQTHLCRYDFARKFWIFSLENRRLIYLLGVISFSLYSPDRFYSLMYPSTYIEKKGLPF